MVRVVFAALGAAVPAALRAEEQALADPAASGLGRWGVLWWIAAFVVLAALVFLVARDRVAGAPRVRR